MNEQEAFEVASRIKSAWPNSFMDEQMVFHWADFLRPYGLDEAVKAIFVLQEKEARLPPQAAFVDVMEGEAAHRAKCPKCGIGFRTEARVQEHIDNVHWQGEDMDEQWAQESVNAVEQMWEITLIDREKWVAALFPFDRATVAAAILKYYETGVSAPEIDELVQVVEKTERLRATMETGTPYVPPDDSSAYDEVDNDLLAPPPWVKGWAVARYRHGDTRVFPEQRAGYDTAQIANPHSRTYVWSEQVLMPEEDAERYIAEGASLTTEQVFTLIKENV